jgi:hypothetical protein
MHGFQLRRTAGKSRQLSLQSLFVVVMLCASILEVPGSSPSISSTSPTRTHSHKPKFARPDDLGLRQGHKGTSKFGQEHGEQDSRAIADAQPNSTALYRMLYDHIFAGGDDAENQDAAWNKNASNARNQEVVEDMDSEDPDDEDEDDTYGSLTTGGLLEAMPRIPKRVQDQFSKADWRDLHRILNICPEQDVNMTMPELCDRLQGRSRLLTEYLRQRLVRLDDGRLVPVPEMYPKIFERADEVRSHVCVHTWP